VCPDSVLAVQFETDGPETKTLCHRNLWLFGPACALPNTLTPELRVVYIAQLFEAIRTRRASHMVQVGSRTSVTNFAGSRDYRFFGSRSQRMRNVRWSYSFPSRNRLFSRFYVVAALLLISCAVFADTPGQVHTPRTPTCYCRCSRAHSRGGCATMCELPKFASRWWAKSCARTHLHTPTEDHDAGPRLHHTDHAERAAR
jgi:hypothetical protein